MAMYRVVVHSPSHTMSTTEYSRPDYDALEAKLAAAIVTASAAEIHGLLTGWLCAPPSAASDGAAFLRKQLAAESPSAARIVNELAGELGDWTRAQLTDPEFAFTPLLPDESEGIARQTEALADWCQGFVYGLAEAGVRDLRRLPKDVREFLEDMLSLAGAESDATASEEDEARALAELVEYVRVGVQHVYETLRGQPPA
jgi:uncharacterized protein YgfB (UPF0149 family)